MKNKITTCSLFLIVFFVFFLFFFSYPAYLQAEGIPEIWSASIKTGGPTAIALDVYETLYIVEAGRNHLLVYNSCGKYLKKIEGLNKPISVAVDNNCRIFIGNAGRGNVEVFDGNLTFLFKLGAGDGEFKHPTAIAVTDEGNIYVADSKENNIKVYNANGSNNFSFGAVGSGDGQFNCPTSIAIDEQNGELIITDLPVQKQSKQFGQIIMQNSIGSARIQIFDMNGDFMRSFGEFGVGEGLLNKPLGVDVDTEGRIYVADAYQNVVQVFDQTGTSLKMIFNSDNPLSTPLDMAIGRETSRLFIASLNTASVEIYRVATGIGPATADAGPDQTVNEGAIGVLDGSDSTAFNDIAFYFWEQTAGMPVTLSDPSAIKPTFTAPDVGPGGKNLSFQLTVIDKSGRPSVDTCIVTIAWINESPIAVAGPDQAIYEGVTVSLDDTGSKDPEGGIASYLWEQIDENSVTLVTLSDPIVSQPTFVAPAVAEGQTLTLTFKLTITDNGGLQDTDEVLLTINDNGVTGFPDEVITFESSTGEDIGIKEDGSTNITNLNALDPDTIEETTNRPQDLIYGLLDAQIKVAAVGDTASVTVYLPNPAPEGYKWFKYDLTNGWINFSRNVISGGFGDGAEFNGDRTKVTLYITDNGDYDNDPRRGIIKDPSGIGIASAVNGGGEAVEDGGEEEAEDGGEAGAEGGEAGGGEVPSSGGGGGGCFIAVMSPICQNKTQKGMNDSIPKPTLQKKVKLSKEEQQKKAIKVFYHIFELSRSKKRAGNLKQIIALYTEIINCYPDVPLAQETYWRLIEMFFREFNPPKKDEALRLYKEYKNRYPYSPLRGKVKGTMIRLLYLNKYWNELLVFTSFCTKDFNNPKKLKSPLPMFYYSEAKFRLNDLKEAFRGYEVIVKYFPDSRMAGTAKKRMAKIKSKKNKSNRNHLLKVGRR